MIYFCDTEFTSFNGDLLSIALVPQDESLPNFYEQLCYDESRVDPWVQKNVLPHMEPDKWNESASHISHKLLRYLQNDNRIVVIADWPEDLTYFLKLLIIGPGMMVNLDNVTTILKRTRNWNSADHSKVPHHALHDAIAIREFWK